MATYLCSNHGDIFTKLRNDFALTKVTLVESRWGHSERRRAFYFECDNYSRRFGNLPTLEIFEVLWEHSVRWQDGEDFE